MDWNALHTLGAVARYGSLAAAGEALGLHPTSVGRRLQGIEQELGQTLVIRRGRLGCTLTPAGAELAARLLPLMDAVDAVGRRAERRRAPVRVAVTPNGGRILAARLDVDALAAAGLELEIDARNTAADLSRGEADLAVRVLEVHEPSLVRRRLGVVRYGLYGSPAYLLHHPVGEDLDCHTFLAPSIELAGGPEGRWIARNASEADIAIRASDHLILAEAAARGLGLVVLPTDLAVFHPLTQARSLDIPGRPVWLVYHQDQRGDARVQAAAAVVAEAIASCLDAEGPEPST